MIAGHLHNFMQFYVNFDYCSVEKKTNRKENTIILRIGK
jgi:hypothetical protein